MLVEADMEADPGGAMPPMQSKRGKIYMQTGLDPHNAIYHLFP